MKLIKHYAVLLTIFLGIDMVWLTLIAPDLYAKALGHLMSDTVNLPAALIFYLVFIVGVQVFILEPALKHRQLKTLVWQAALFGLVTYATYDLTNLATLKDWPLAITLIDLTWGTSLSVLVATLSYLFISRKEAL